MSSHLIKYEAACRALAECKSVDEAKSWTDKAAAMQAYGRMAKDRTLEVDAAEIRIRAERRLGEMIAAQKAQGGLSKGGAGMAGNQHTGKLVPSSQTSAPKLADAGISHDLSSRAQKLAAVPAGQFEAELAAKRERDKQDGARVSARLEAAGAKVLRDAEPIPDDDFGPSAEEIAASQQGLDDELAAMRRVIESDDKLAEALAIIKQRDAMVQKLSWQINSLTNQLASMTKTAKYWQRKAGAETA